MSSLSSFPSLGDHKNEEFLLFYRPQGVHDLTQTWKLTPCEYPTLKSSLTPSFITASLFFSVDPYLSSSIKKSALGGAAAEIGTVQHSACLSRVIESSHSDWPVGTLFESRSPWRLFNHFVTAPTRYKIVKRANEGETLFDRLGLSTSVGNLGMPSQTAFYASTQVMTLKPTDVLLVSGAAGAVGHVFVQIAKKCLGVGTVIGTAGGRAKCSRIVDLGCDFAIDYKEFDTEEKMGKRILELTQGRLPTQYFDNTGGHVTDAFFNVCARKAFVCVCGQISAYNLNESESRKFPNYLAKTIYKALTIQGFVWSDFQSQNDEKFFPQMEKWINEGKLKFDETIVNGFENLPKAYQMLFTGENTGKVVVDCTKQTTQMGSNL